MLKTVLTLILSLIIVSLFSLTFDEGLKSVADSVALKLKHPKSDCLSFVSLKSTNKVGKNYPLLDEYVLKAVVGYLKNDSKVRVIDPLKVTEVLTTNLKGFNVPTDYKRYQAFCKEIYALTNQSTNVLVGGVIYVDKEFFNITLTLYNPKTATKLGNVVKKVPMDENSDKLLGLIRPKLLPSPVSMKQAEPKPVPVQAVEAGPSPEPIAPKVVPLPLTSAKGWFEDFSKYAVGDPIPTWGTDAIVVEGKDKRKYLSSQVRGDFYVKVPIGFPQDFVFKFDCVNNTSADLSLGDEKDREFKIDLGIWYSEIWVQLPDNKKTTLKSREINTYRFEKSGNAIKCFINGEYAQTAVTQDLNSLKFFRMRLPGKCLFTNFSITPLE